MRLHQSALAQQTTDGLTGDVGSATVLRCQEKAVVSVAVHEQETIAIVFGPVNRCISMRWDSHQGEGNESAVSMSRVQIPTLHQIGSV